MTLLFIFRKSLLLPHKKALFDLNKIGMKDTILYMVCLMFLLFLPDVVQSIVEIELTDERISYGTYILQLVVFYPLLILFIVVAGVSTLAAVSLMMNKVLRRTLSYQLLWKMTAYALTMPLLVYTILNFFRVDPFAVNVFPLIIFCFLMFRMILYYPKMNEKN